MQPKLRQLKASDVAFILSSWLRSYRTSKFGKAVTNEIYYPEQSRTILALLADSQIVIACNPEDDDHIFGYALGHEHPTREEAFMLHYVYVKHSFRRFGIATAMVDELAKKRAVYVTHWRPVCKTLGWQRASMV